MRAPHTRSRRTVGKGAEARPIELAQDVADRWRKGAQEQGHREARTPSPMGAPVNTAPPARADASHLRRKAKTNNTMRAA